MTEFERNRATPPTVTSPHSRYRGWGSWVFSVLISVGVIAWLAIGIDWNQVGRVLLAARPIPIVIALLMIIVTNLLKTLRWQKLYTPSETEPQFIPAFWSLMLNQFVNNIPFVRVGELARIHTIYQSCGTERARSLGTIVIEKSLEMVFMMLSILIFLPWIALPTNFTTPLNNLAITTVGILAVLYPFIYHPSWVLKIAHKSATWIPGSFGRKLLQILASGLDGLAALRDRRAIFMQLLLSTLVTLGYILTPYFLFFAFDLPFSFIDASLINFAITLAILPPSTPLKIGVIQAVILGVMAQRYPNANHDLLFSYGMMFNILIMVPPILLGGWAALRSDWGWRTQSPP